MPILMPKDTHDVLRKNEDKFESRSLFFDRFADPEARDKGKEAPRRKWFATAVGKKPETSQIQSWKQFLTEPGLGIAPDFAFNAELQSRLLVNMAGGVMTNAGLCLNRFGVPYIPGSAVKGCARRMALFELGELSLDNPSPEILAQSLVRIALVFGWAESDWMNGRKKRKRAGKIEDAEPISDFWHALCVDVGDQSADATRDERWKVTSNLAARELFHGIGRKPNNPELPWAPQLPNFASSTAFLPAYPIELPGKDLELDVATPHHKEYYGRKKDHSGRLTMPIALDTEETEPVLFPAVVRGVVFRFVTLPLSRIPITPSERNVLNRQANQWLRTGLETMGIGGKTSAGYGFLRDPQRNERGTSGSAGPQPTVSSGSDVPVKTPEHPLIAAWRGRTQSENIKAFRPFLAQLKDDAELHLVFHAIMPSRELAKPKRSDRYWQSFTSHPEGVAILKRLNIKLQ
jgi:CRISPR/Cas system CMR subunit Cmr6 (Cas7 group RAMP superfamily)